LLSGKFAKRGINKKAENGAQHRNDIALTLAIPMLAGPGSYRSNCFLSRTQHATKKSSSLHAGCFGYYF
jgi:small neutral amino acid transporter SnatA (MarC family)